MAGFVKLDAGMLDSTVWFDRDVRDVFITALLMAELREFRQPVPQLEVNSLEHTGWEVPPGWYGVAHAASIGIVNRAGVSIDRGMAALVKMGQPEPESRSSEFEGRRLVRVNGGFVVLNYLRYRDKDYGAAERMARFRARKKLEQEARSKRAPRAKPTLLGRDKKLDATYNLELMRQDAERRKKSNGT